MALFMDATAEGILSWYFGNNTMTPPATFYIGASTTSYAEDGTGGTEVTTATDPQYARVAITNTSANFNAATALGNGIVQVTNNAQIQFPQATAAWGDITELGLYTSTSATTPVAVATLDAPITVSANGQLTFKVGQVKFQFKFN